jgi:hypothetical protein
MLIRGTVYFFNPKTGNESWVTPTFVAGARKSGVFFPFPVQRERPAPLLARAFHR